MESTFHLLCKSIALLSPWNQKPCHSQHLNQVAAKKSRAMGGKQRMPSRKPEQHTVRPHLVESQVSHRYGWQSKKLLSQKSISKNCLSQLLLVLHFFYTGWQSDRFMPSTSIYVCLSLSLSLGMDGINIYIHTCTHMLSFLSLAFTTL